MSRRKFYDHTKISNIPDSRMLFNMSQHVMTNIFEQNESFLNILEDMPDRVTSFKTKISIPFDNHSADEILKEREFGIFWEFAIQGSVCNQRTCVCLNQWHNTTHICSSNPNWLHSGEVRFTSD